MTFREFMTKYFSDLGEQYARGVIYYGAVPAGCQRLLLMVAEARMRRLVANGVWKSEVQQ